MDPILDGLNARQTAAVTSTVPILQVLAPPGSGKTKTLTARVAYLLAHHGYEPSNVICCTFTKKASLEMKARLTAVIGEKLSARLLMGTFHSLCCRYLRRYGQLIGLRENFGVADKFASMTILKKVIQNLDASVELKSCQFRISKWKARCMNLVEGSNPILGKTAKVREQEQQEIYEEYQRQLELSSLLDYDDLMVQCVRLLREHPACVSNIETVLIDEFQDTNNVQLELMKLFAWKNQRVTIVGDPDQSIYGFRSAEIQNLTRMQQYYSQMGVEYLVVNLEENYRSSAAVLRLAQKVIDQDSFRPNKSLKATHGFGTLPVVRHLYSARDEAEWIVSEIRRTKAMTGDLTNFADFAILLRSAHLSLSIEKAAGKAGLPYKMIGSNPFFEREEIRILLNYLRTISHPDNNTALSAIINVPSRKIGEESLRELLRLANDKGISLWVTVQNLTKGEFSMRKKLSRPAEQDLCKLILLIKNARERMRTVPAESTPNFLLQYCVEKLKYKEFLRKRNSKDEDYDLKCANVEELLSYTNEMAQAGPADKSQDEDLPEIEGLQQRQQSGNEESLANFLANIVVSADVQAVNEGEEKDCISMLTIHAAKGLEWPFVFVPGVFDGSIPNSRAEDNDEERRILYVAITRAQALLNLSYPSRFRDESETTLSRFLTLDQESLVVSFGPIFTDKVIRDIARILRRPPPSQDALLKGIKTLTERESSQDDLWPLDGSERPRQYWDTHIESTSRSDEGKQSTTFLPPAVLPQEVRLARAQSLSSGPKAEISMSQLAVTSTCSTSLGFSTAAQVHKTACFKDPPRLPSDLKDSDVKDSIKDQEVKTAVKTKGRKPRETPGQTKLASFFASTTTSTTQPQPPSNIIPEPELPPQPRVLASSTSNGMRSSALLGTHRIPTKPTSFKRPRYTDDGADVKATRYIELSSSPNRVTHRDTLTVRITNAGPSIAPQTTSLPQVSESTSILNVTSMNAVRQKAPIPGRNLGVRRTHNGWENRKHK